MHLSNKDKHKEYWGPDRINVWENTRHWICIFFFFNLPLILIWSRILNSNISIVITLESSNETSNPYKKKKACTCFFFFSVASSNETSISLDISKNACFLNSNAEFQGMLTSSCCCRRRNCGVCRSVWTLRGRRGSQSFLSQPEIIQQFLREIWSFGHLVVTLARWFLGLPV